MHMQGWPLAVEPNTVLSKFLYSCVYCFMLCVRLRLYGCLCGGRQKYASSCRHSSCPQAGYRLGGGTLDELIVPPLLSVNQGVGQ